MPLILILEDDAQIRSIWVSYLGHRGMEVQAASTAEAGLLLLDNTPFNLVLLDLHLDGDLKGLGFLQALDVSRCRPLVIVVSGYLTEEAAMRALALGAARLVRKPCTASDLYLHVRYVLQGPRGYPPASLVRAEFAHIRSLAQVAGVLGQHPHTICRRIRASTGLSYHAYITGIRIAKAQELLATTDQPIGEVYRAVGYGSYHGLERAFAARVGCTPDQYRRRVRARGRHDAP